MASADTPSSTQPTPTKSVLFGVCVPPSPSPFALLGEGSGESSAVCRDPSPLPPLSPQTQGRYETELEALRRAVRQRDRSLGETENDAADLQAQVAKARTLADSVWAPLPPSCPPPRRHLRPHWCHASHRRGMRFETCPSSRIQ